MERKKMIGEITTELTILAQKLTRLEKKPFHFGTGETLTKAEIHTIEAIGKNRGCTVSALCNQFAITKGAVSQVVGKLAAKDYVIKETNLSYVKEKILTLDDLNSCDKILLINSVRKSVEVVLG